MFKRIKEDIKSIRERDPAVKSDLEVTVPSGSVIISVAGQAVGTPNPTPIKNGVQ